jgi:hypothetical protein
MTKTIAAIALAALAAGCAKTGNITPDEARNALPQAAALQIETPEDTAARAQAALVVGAQAERASTEFNPGFWSTSEYARWTYFTAWTVNGGAWWTLTVLRFVTIFPPTQCDETTCTWGPWDENSTNPLTPGLKIKSWRLVVTKVDEGHFEYVLSAKNLLEPAAEYLTIVSGVAFPQDPWRGHGEFTINFENARQLPEPKPDYGVLTIRYNNESALSVDATVLDGRSADDGTLMNAAYSFDATAAGGELQVAFETREGNLASVSLRSRWEAGGAGRGDARVYTTDGTWTLTGEASECWDDRIGGFDLTYDTDPVVVGTVARCPVAFQTASYSDLVVP